MARLRDSTVKLSGTIPVPPPPPRKTRAQLTQEQEAKMVLCVPKEFEEALKMSGVAKQITGRGPGKDGNNTKIRKMIKDLKNRQHLLTIQMKGKNIMVKENATLQELEDAYTKAENGVFRVESILNSRKKGGVLTYLVLWEGFPLELATWEPANTLDKNIHLIRDFHKTFKHKPGQPVANHHDVLGRLDVEVEDSESSDDGSEEELDEAGTPKPKTKKVKVVPAVEPRLGSGGEAAQAMRPISRSPKAKRTPGTTPGTRKSPRTFVPVYENLNDKALYRGRVKRAEAKSDAIVGSDPVTLDMTPAPNPIHRPRKAAPAAAAVFGMGADSDDDDNEEVVIMETPRRTANIKRDRRAVKSGATVDSLFGSEADSDPNLPIRKKAKKYSERPVFDDDEFNQVIDEALETRGGKNEDDDDYDAGNLNQDDDESDVSEEP